ncbi:MAG: response regulator [Verrucomicrobia bacterium]|nr:response regulator [Verrucomicrobiota bacterium]
MSDHDDNSLHRRILVIDDNQAIHEDFAKVLGHPTESEATLAEAGAALFGPPPDQLPRIEFQIDSAFQGQEGLALVRQAQAENHPFALAFVDVRMPPGWDGIETTAKIWEQDPEMQIVICTAYSDYSWTEMLARLRRPDQLLVLKKPFDTIEVLQLTHALTVKWQLQKAAQFKLRHLELHVASRTRVLEEANAKLQSEINRLAEALRQCEESARVGAPANAPTP